MAEPTEVFLLHGLDGEHILRVGLRLVLAAGLGALLGVEREREQKAAGMRTHMLVAMGATLFVVAALEAGIALDQISRVVQGMISGIGFLGAGVILKLQERTEVKGLTTAASIWVTAAMGTALGFGLIWPAVIGVALAWIILTYFQRVERWVDQHRGHG